MFTYKMAQRSLDLIIHIFSRVLYKYLKKILDRCFLSLNKYLKKVSLFMFLMISNVNKRYLLRIPSYGCEAEPQILLISFQMDCPPTLPTVATEPACCRRSTSRPFDCRASLTSQSERPAWPVDPSAVLAADSTQFYRYQSFFIIFMI